MTQFIHNHFEALILLACGLLITVCAVAWLQQHDARVRAEFTLQQAQDRIAGLQQDKAAITKQMGQKVTALQVQGAKVQTPAQAIAEIPKVSALPLDVRPVPGLPTAVTVDALPLYKDLMACKITEAKLDGCTQLRAKDAQILTEKDGQITTLKKQSSFMKRAVHTLEVLGIGAVVGYVAHR